MLRTSAAVQLRTARVLKYLASSALEILANGRAAGLVAEGKRLLWLKKTVILLSKLTAHPL